GKITLEQLETAAAGIEPGRRIGAVLVDEGSLEAQELVDGVLLQVREIVLEWFEWTEGEYQFQDGDLPTDEVIKLDIDMGRIILEGIRRIRSFERIRRSVGSLQTVYGLADGWRDTIAGVEFAEGEELILVRLEQGDESVDGLCGEAFLSNFEIYQALWALSVMGVVVEKPKRFDTEGLTLEGSLADRPFVDLIVEMAAADATGVLQVQRGSHKRTFHLQEGRCVFSTSNQSDDGLMAYLLRRGVISLRDREEVTQRLLTNKRVGTILLEMGVIDNADLTEMIRQQLMEILFDTFGWTDADYGFRAGELPTLEKITMQESIEQLVSEGLRHVVDWDRIVAGIGGLDSKVELTPTYLDRLDALHGGPAEWQVVAALQEPATVRRLCRTVDLPDYRVCQIIWALRVLDAVICRPGETEIETHVEVTSSVVVVDVDEQQEPADEPIAVHQDEETGYAFVDSEADADQTQAMDRSAVEAALSAAPDDKDDDAIHVSVEKEEEDETASIQVARDDLVDEHEERIEPLDLDVASRTVRLDREEVDRMIAGESEEDTSAEPSLDDWQPPDDLDGAIERFNAMQRVVFLSVKSEIGAGTVNLIRACCQSAEDDLPALRDAELREDGTWDAEELRRAIHDRRIDDPMTEYLYLIELEIEQLSAHLGDGKVAELKQQVSEHSP
ncbi:MAG: DUF4388 domain-containing protein, partial [Acidobacteriota bacterium]|nr:DUF4388 domain-containing protein [Acidobacteriota bacterium]